MRPAIRSHPHPLALACHFPPAQSHFQAHYHIVVLVFYMSLCEFCCCCQRDIFKLQAQIYIVCPRLRRAPLHTRSAVSISQFLFYISVENVTIFGKFTFTISCIFTNLHICWHFLLGVIISFDTADERARRPESALQMGCKVRKTSAGGSFVKCGKSKTRLISP